jgi:hypothetical protein
MKQQFLWGGAALIVLGAAAAFFAVDYAYRNPTSMLARLGVAATFAGLNPNPLSDINPAVIGGAGVHLRRPVIEAQITTHDQSAVVPMPFGPVRPGTGFSVGVATNDPAEETIEPIQVEAVPPATGEPPVDGEESEWKGEWRPMFERGSVEQIEQMPKECPNDEDNAGQVMNVLRGLSKLRCGQSCPELWEAVEGANVEGTSGGCLTWFEYCAPEQLLVMPTEVPRSEDNQDDDPVIHANNNETSAPMRKTEIIQLKWAKSADVVTAVETYIVNLVNIFNTIGQNTWLPELQRDVVLVGDPTTNKLILNVSPGNFEGLVNLIEEIDQSAQSATEECEHGSGAGCYHGCGQRHDKPCWPPREHKRKARKQDGTQETTPDKVETGTIPIDDMLSFNGCQGTRVPIVILNPVPDKTQLERYDVKDWPDNPEDTWKDCGAANLQRDGCIAPRTPGLEDVDATIAKIERALEERKLGLSFDNVPLCNCVQAIQEYVGNINIVADDTAIQEAGISMEQTVTLCVKDVTLKAGLTQLLKIGGLTYAVEKQGITIRPRPGAMTADQHIDK